MTAANAMWTLISTFPLRAAVGRPAVEHCLEGFNVAVIAYGQTGAGKTHSMIGVLPAAPPAPCAMLADDPTSQAGLAPRVFEALFEGLGRQRGDGGRPVSTLRGSRARTSSALSPCPLLYPLIGFSHLDPPQVVQAKPAGAEAAGVPCFECS